jgi:hypothetical protein
LSTVFLSTVNSLRFLTYGFLLFSCTYHDLTPTPLPPPEEEEEPPFVCDAAEVTWTGDILPLLTRACATSGCHDGIARRDWRNYNEVKAAAADIKRQTQSRNMPFDGPLPQREIDMIACWVDQGALNN